MNRRHRTGRPDLNDPVYVASRTADNMQPNGFVLSIDREDGEVIVQFHASKGLKGGDRESYSLSQFEGNYDDSFGGVWKLEDN